jgi:glycine/D-amino acid oxidase-like deaminating enzyme
MAIPARDVLAVATAQMPMLLAKYLPKGGYRFGTEYVSPHPHGSAKRQRDYHADIVVNAKGAWRDNLAGASGVNIVQLLAHIRNTTLGKMGAELARTLRPEDCLRGQPIPPGLRGRSKEEDTGSYYMALNKGSPAQRRDALFKFAQENTPRLKFKRRK